VETLGDNEGARNITATATMAIKVKNLSHRG
jgi:hypothetical protein